MAVRYSAYMLEMLIAAVFSMQQHASLIETANARACSVTLESGHAGLQEDTAGIPFQYVGENLGFYPTATKDNEAWILYDWIVSPMHLAVLKNGYTHFGLGRCNGAYVLHVAK